MLVHMLLLKVYSVIRPATLASIIPVPSFFSPTSPACACPPLPTCPSRPMLDISETQSQCENIILSNISPLSESDRGENGLKFRFARPCLVGTALGGAREAMRAGLVGWLVERQGNPEQDYGCSGHCLAEQEHVFVKF